MARVSVVSPGTHPELLNLAIGLDESSHAVSFFSSSFLPPGRARLATSLSGIDQIRGRTVPSSSNIVVRSPGFGLEGLYQIARRKASESTSLRILRARNRRFDWAVAHSRTVGRSDIVVAQQGSARVAFSASRGAFHVLNAPIAHPGWSMNYLQREAIENPAWAEFIQFPFRNLREKQIVDLELGQADLILVASQFSRETYLESGVSEEKVRVVPLGGERQELVPMPPVDSGIRVLFAGQVNQRKGIGYLLSAMEKLDGATLRVAGPFTNGSERLVDQHRLVDFVGDLSREDLFDNYRWAHLVVLPSLVEGFGLTALEAMSVGRPVLVSEHTFGPDLLRHRISGLIVPPKDSGSIRSEILWARDHFDQLEMIAKAAHRVQQDQTWKSFQMSAIHAISSAMQ